MKFAILFVFLIGVGAQDVIDMIQQVYSQPTREQALKLHKAFMEAGRDVNFTQNWNENSSLPNVKAFSCDTLSRSATTPTSVHNLRPGDIDIVGALGDSLTAAFGADAWNVLNIANWKEVRGKSFTVGGLDTVDTYTTLANVLKKANPNIVGFSTGETTYLVGPDDVSAAQMNRARSGAVAGSLPEWTDIGGYRGEVYNWTTVGKQLYGDEFLTKWKLLTLFIGSNNLCWACPCDGCNTSRHTTSLVKQQILETLDYIKANSPRTLVSIVQPIDTTRINLIKNAAVQCSTMLGLECPCGSSSNSEWRALVTERTVEYQEMFEEIQAMDTYNTDDMAVVLQPFMKGVEPPVKNSTGKYDLTYFAPDCFHFSAKAHSAAGVALWNDLTISVDKKDTTWYPGEALYCPPADNVICTTKNRGVGEC